MDSQAQGTRSDQSDESRLEKAVPADAVPADNDNDFFTEIEDVQRSMVDGIITSW